jgi:hypothetical protein
MPPWSLMFGKAFMDAIICSHAVRARPSVTEGGGIAPSSVAKSSS